MQYYAHAIIDSGRKCIVSLICQDQCQNQQLLFAKLPTLEVDLHLLLAIFSNSLTWSQQIKFGEILGLVNTFYVTKEFEVIAKIPSSFED
jgi:hypothetical protein